MWKFDIEIRSLRQIREFTELASRQPFEVLVGNAWQELSGKDYMAMFCLDFTQPVQVQVACTKEELACFQDGVRMILTQ